MVLNSLRFSPRVACLCWVSCKLSKSHPIGCFKLKRSIAHCFGTLLSYPDSPVPAPIERGALWKEVRSYKHYMVIGSEMVNHGVQIFDMTKLLDIDPKDPVKFDPVKDVTAHFTDLPGPGRSHNVVVY